MMYNLYISTAPVTIIIKSTLDILWNIFYYVPPKKEGHTGLEWHEGE